MKAEKIIMYGELQGKMWMGGTATKHFQYIFTEKQQAFSFFEWGGLEDALNRITNDGDFRCCGVRECWIKTIYQEGNKKIVIEKELPDCKLTHDYIVPEDERVYPEREEV